MLSELHAGHLGIVKMKSVARNRIWWPGIDSEIEDLARKCVECQQTRSAPPTGILHPWSWPGKPWQRLHIDFAGPFMGLMFLVVVDSHSKWLEVIPMSSTTAQKTVSVLRQLFTAYGLPEQVVSDNGPQFVSSEFSEFMRENGVKHIRTSPYHPSSNGEAERFVQTFKRALKAGSRETGTVEQKLCRFLLAYRSSPHCTTGVSPAELFLGRPVRTRLDLLKPSVAVVVRNKQADQKAYHDAHSKERQLAIGQAVWVRNFRNGPSW